MNEIAKTSDDNQLIFLSENGRTYCSLALKTEADRLKFFNVINNPEKRLKDFINMPIEVKDIFAEDCEFVDQETGEISGVGVRMVLIDKDGVGYQAASKGVFSSMSKLIALLGEPSTWKKPVKIIPKLINKGNNRSVMIFEVAQ